MCCMSETSQPPSLHEIHLFHTTARKLNGPCHRLPGMTCSSLRPRRRASGGDQSSLCWSAGYRHALVSTLPQRVQQGFGCTPSRLTVASFRSGVPPSNCISTGLFISPCILQHLRFLLYLLVLFPSSLQCTCFLAQVYETHKHTYIIKHTISNSSSTCIPFC